MKIKMNLRSKLLLQFLVVGIVPLSIMGILAYVMASQSLENAAFEKLSSVQQVKKSSVERYFQGIKDQIITFSENQMIIDAALETKKEFHRYADKLSSEKIESMKKQLFTYYSGPFANEYRAQNKGADPKVKEKIDQLDNKGIALQYHYIQANYHPLGSKHLLDGADDSSGYSRVHQKIHPIIRSYLEKFGYYDIFIVDADTGHIIYSVFKELDYATSLLDGPYKDTNFAEVFKSATESSNKDFIRLIDYKQYAPSYEAPASFIASPIFDGDKKVAVAVFQMPIDRLNTIMSERSGMGQTGETVLVGSDGLVRSDSYVDKKRSVVDSFRNKKDSKVDQKELKIAMAGKSGRALTDSYLGEQVLSSYSPVNVIGLTWVILAQMNATEALKPAITLGYWMGGVALGSVLLSLLFGAIIGRSIANPILTVAGELEENSKHVAGASDGLAGSSGNLSELAARQASSIEETASSIEEISAMVKNNVEQAEKSSTLSGQVKNVADKGNQSMNKLVTSMEEIIASNQKIQDLVKVIGEIGEKTSVIDEIVFQTKLLSFNASVEAERAGEHGRGFAVVAQEVGNLAQMSGKAASEIAAMVKGSIRNAEEITSDNKSKVETGNSLVQETAKYLEEIAQDAEILLKQAQQIVNSSKEQSEGISQVNEAMNQLDHTTQQNSVTAEKTAHSSEQLASQADNLKSNVDNLLILVEGNADVGHQKTAQLESSQNKVVSIESKKAAKVEKANIKEFKKVSGDSAVSADDGNWEKL